MNKIILLASFCLFVSSAFSQESIQFDGYVARISGSKLETTNNSGSTIYSKAFFNPSILEYDLDNDGSSELLLLDSSASAGKPFFRLYIYNTVDNFSLADSIISGSTEPYQVVSDEAGGTIIISGNADFESYNKSPDVMILPINCWKYESGELMLINDEIYDNFIAENDELTAFLEDYFSSNIKNCTSSSAVRAAIAAVYVNYISAGENVIASQFIKKYYLCGDLDVFLAELNKLAGNSDKLK